MTATPSRPGWALPRISCPPMSPIQNRLPQSSTTRGSILAVSTYWSTTPASAAARAASRPVPEEIFDRTIAVNLRAPWMAMKLVFPLLRERGGGSIITTSSISALLGMPGQGAYGASKAAILQLTRVAAMEGAKDFIRVNAVCPGGILTPIIYDTPLLDRPTDVALVANALAKAQPIPRAGLPEDIANAILWLASDESSFVTGQAIAIDGGLTAEFGSEYRLRPAKKE